MKLPRLLLSGVYQWELPASKSLSNRWLIINHLCNSSIRFNNLSQAGDTALLQQLLKQLTLGADNTYHCQNAGTVARFITALLATREGTFTVTCDQRMKQRPIAELIKALRFMGAKIRYLEQEGFLPAEIQGVQLKGGEVRLSGKESSQFASALILVAPTMTQPLTIQFDSRPVSKSYISMTCNVLKSCGAQVEERDEVIKVDAVTFTPPTGVSIEKDWSSAAYAYNAVAFSPQSSIFLPQLGSNSFQGDKAAAEWYSRLGVETTFLNNGILLKNNGVKSQSPLVFHCSDNPDLVPPLAVACAGLGTEALFLQIDTLNLKESRRLEALSTELSKIGCPNVATHNSLHISPSQLSVKEKIKTYNDHRLAMSFATLACLSDSLEIDNPDSVEKSFPNFFEQLLNPKKI